MLAKEPASIPHKNSKVLVVRRIFARRIFACTRDMSGSNKRAADDWPTLTLAHYAAKKQAFITAHTVTPVVVAGEYSPQLVIKGLPYDERQLVSSKKLQESPSHPLDGCGIFLKGILSHNDNRPHFELSLTKKSDWNPSMPVANLLLAEKTAAAAKAKLWPNLSWKPLQVDKDVNWPQRDALFLQISDAQTDYCLYAIVPGPYQQTRSNVLDWEPLFLAEFSMFSRATVDVAQYKGTAFTCDAANLSSDQASAVQEWWKSHNFDVSRDKALAK